MLKTLTIRNLVLIEEASLHFSHGLTVITGETGAGKTALIDAIGLLLGERADTSKLRRGAEKAQIQAIFSPPSKQLLYLLDEGGISASEDEDLLISREIALSGKSRALVNNQPISLALLQSIKGEIIDFIGQHATVELRSLALQRDFLDAFAKVEFKSYQNCWEEEKEAKSALEEAREKQLQSQRAIDILIEECEELSHALDGESEDKLIEEHNLLSNMGELTSLSEIALAHNEEVFAGCRSLEKILLQLQKLSPDAKEAYKMATDAALQIDEIERILQSITSRLESDPNRLAFIEERLATFHRLHKKYGVNLPQIHKEKTEELNELEKLDTKLEKLEKAYTLAKGKTQTEVEHIRTKRLIGAKNLEEHLSKHLKELNFKTAELEIRISQVPRTKTGEDEIEFYLQTNKGEPLVSIKDSISGGELSRLLFALKIALANSTPSALLVFDEIDANIGGETATCIGKKLSELAQKRQILCITHFPQVAKYGDHHFCVLKKEEKTRTQGQIISLSPKDREKELLRMLGGIENLTSTTKSSLG